MGTSCLSTQISSKEEEDINTEKGCNQSIEKLKDESSATPTPTPSKPDNNHDIDRKESNHHKNMNSLDSIDEYSPIQIDEYDDNHHVLTHEALRQHDMSCAMGIDSMSLSSVSSTDIDDDRLKQIGNQLLSMNIDHASSNNEKEKQHQHKLNELQIPTDTKDEKNMTKYKQYKLRRPPNQCNKMKPIRKNDEIIENNPFSNKNDNTTHSRNTSITLSETPVPNDYHIINYNHNKPKYQKINSNSHQLHHQQCPHKNGKNHNIFRQDADEQYIENEVDETDESEEDLNFPDVIYFDNNNDNQ